MNQISFTARLLFIASVGWFSACQKQAYLADTTVSYHRIEHGKMRSDTIVTAMILPYKQKVDAAMGEVIGQSEMEMIKAKPTSALTNWMADALLAETHSISADSVDFVILNYGGVRVTSMPAGNWTLGSLYELMPFDNVLYLAKIPGNTVRQLCNHMAAAGGWPVSHTLRFTLFYGKASEITIHGQALDTNAVYTVALPDYIYLGGDNVTFLKTCQYENTGMLIRDMLISQVRKKTASGQSINALSDDRIR